MDRLEELKKQVSSGSANDFSRRAWFWLICMCRTTSFSFKGSAPSEAIKNEVWSQIKAADAQFSDLTCDLQVDSSLPQPQAAAAAAAPNGGGAGQTYTVKQATRFPKSPRNSTATRNAYNKIFEANKDQLSSPDRINVGQELKIP